MTDNAIDPKTMKQIEEAILGIKNEEGMYAYVSEVSIELTYDEKVVEVIIKEKA